jgi:hypothetical protein
MLKVTNSLHSHYIENLTDLEFSKVSASDFSFYLTLSDETDESSEMTFKLLADSVGEITIDSIYDAIIEYIKFDNKHDNVVAYHPQVLKESIAHRYNELIYRISTAHGLFIPNIIIHGISHRDNNISINMKDCMNDKYFYIEFDKDGNIVKDQVSSKYTDTIYKINADKIIKHAKAQFDIIKNINFNVNLQD